MAPSHNSTLHGLEHLIAAHANSVSTWYPGSFVLDTVSPSPLLQHAEYLYSHVALYMHSITDMHIHPHGCAHIHLTQDTHVHRRIQTCVHAHLRTQGTRGLTMHTVYSHTYLHPQTSTVHTQTLSLHARTPTCMCTHTLTHKCTFNRNTCGYTCSYHNMSSHAAKVHTHMCFPGHTHIHTP